MKSKKKKIPKNLCVKQKETHIQKTNSVSFLFEIIVDQCSCKSECRGLPMPFLTTPLPPAPDIFGDGHY